MLQDVCISKQEPWCRRENRTMPLQISIGIEFYNGTVRFLCHSTAFLYRPTSTTAQMLKLDKVPARWFSRRWRKITAIAENHGPRPKKATIIDIIDDTDNIDPSLLRNLCPWLTVSQVATTGSHRFTRSQHTIPIGLHFAADITGLSLVIFYGRLRKTMLFLQEWRFGRSRSTKVIDFSTNRKRVCDFLLVHHSNLGRILHCVGDIADFLCCWLYPYSTLIMGVFPLHQIAHVGVNVSRCVKLFGCEIIFEVFQPMWSQYLNVTDGRTDDIRRHNRALRSIAW